MSINPDSLILRNILLQIFCDIPVISLRFSFQNRTVVRFDTFALVLVTVRFCSVFFDRFKILKFLLVRNSLHVRNMDENIGFFEIMIISGHFVE